MKRILLTLLASVTALCISAQKAVVVDNTNLQPIADVAFFTSDQKLSVISNNRGLADMGAFKGQDSIWITHVSYISKIVSYAKLESSGFKITLSEKSFSMDELMISASKFEEKLKDVAQPVQIIKSKELAFMNQQTSAEVMQNTGNVLVQKSQLGGGSPIIRGFETNKVLMVVDGVRMNNAIYRGGHLQNIITVDNTMMDKIEIVYGPGSVVYGSDALGGVMHFYTKNPILTDDDELVIRANAFTRYSSAFNEKTGHVDFSIGGKKFGSITSFTYSDFGDLRQGNNRNPFYGDWGKREWYVENINGVDSILKNADPNIQKQSGYSQYDVLQKFMFKQSDNVSHIVNLQFSTSSEIPRYDRLTQMSGTNPKYGEWYYGAQNRLFGSYTLSLKGDKGLYDQAKVVLAYQNVEESRHDRRYKKTTLNNRYEKLDIASLNIDFAKKIKKNEIRYGFDAWYNKVNSTANELNVETGESSSLDTRYPDGGSTMQSFAGYITHSLEISDKLILNDGIRVNNVQLNALFNDTTFFPFPFRSVNQNNTAVNGNIGLVYMPGMDWRFALIGSTGFRAPNVDDLSKVFDSSPGSVVVPNPNLKPENTYNIDLGISKKIKDQVNVGVTGYYTWYKNAITTRPGLFDGADSIMYSGQLSRVLTNANASEAYIYGANAYFNVDVTENFSITNTINYTYGRIKTDSTDVPLDHIAPVFGKTGFNLKLNKFRGEFFVMYSGEKKSWDYNLNGEDNFAFSTDPVNGYMPAWLTLNVRTAFQFNKFVQLQVALENILDQNYRGYASNISAPGRNLVVTLRGNF